MEVAQTGEPDDEVQEVAWLVTVLEKVGEVRGPKRPDEALTERGQKERKPELPVVGTSSPLCCANDTCVQNDLYAPPHREGSDPQGLRLRERHAPWFSWVMTAVSFP